MHRVAQSPTQHLARGPIHDRDQVQEAVLDWHERDISAPDLIGAVDRHASKQIWIDRVLRMPLAGSGAFVDCLQAHRRHQLSDAMPPDNCALSSQIGSDLTTAEERIFGADSVNLFHHGQRIRVDTDWRIIKR